MNTFDTKWLLASIATGIPKSKKSSAVDAEPCNVFNFGPNQLKFSVRTDLIKVWF